MLKRPPAFVLNLSLFLTVLVFTAIISAGGGTAMAAGAGLEIGTDRLVYRPGDTVSFDLTLESGGQNLSGDLVIKVYPVASSLATDAFSRPPLSETSVEKNYSFSGREAISFKASVRELGVGAGGYPVRVSLVKNGEEVLGGNSWLAVADPDGREPVDLVLLWTVGGPPETNADGEFVSTGLLDRCRAVPQAPDTLLQHQAVQQRFPRIKTTYAIEPALLDQLETLSGGFNLREGGGVRNYPAASAEAAAAAGCLESLRSLGAGGNVEILSSPYVFTSLPLLARQGWADGNGQFRMGDDVLTASLALPSEPRGAYAPGLNLTTDSLRYLAATGGEYCVLSGSSRANVQGRPQAEAPAYRLRDISGERITGMFAADDVSAALLGEQPDTAAFFAGLANAYAAEGTPRLVIAAASAPVPAITAAQRERVYEEIDREPWIHSLTLAEARQKYHPGSEPSTLLKYEDPVTGYVAQTYYRKLEAVHDLFEDYRAAVDSDEPELVRLSKKMFTAESGYWSGDGAAPEESNRGLSYMESIERFARGEFQNLAVEVDTPLMQGVGESEATVTVFNGNPYPFTVDIVIDGDGIQLAEGPEQRLRLETGKTELKVPYRTEGWSRLTARVQTRGHELAGDSAGVRLITGRAWMLILIIAAALAGAATYITLVARRR